MRTGPNAENSAERIFAPLFQRYLNFAEHLLPLRSEIEKAQNKTWSPWKLILLSEKLFKNANIFVNHVTKFYRKNNDLLKTSAQQPTIKEAKLINKKWNDVLDLFVDLPQELIDDMQLLKTHVVDIKHPEINAGIRLGDEKIRILDEKVKTALSEMNSESIQERPSPKFGE